MSSEVKKAKVEHDDIDLFGDLIAKIMSFDKSEADEREAFIRKSAKDVPLLIRFLANMIVNYEKQHESKNLSNADDDSDDGEFTETDVHQLNQFSVECLMYITSAASMDKADDNDDSGGLATVCASIAAVFIEPGLTELLYRLNARILNGRATSFHLGILVNLTRSPAFVSHLVAKVIVPRFPSNHENGKGLIPSLIAILRVPQTSEFNNKAATSFNNRTLVAGYLNNLTMSPTVRQLIVERRLIAGLLALYESRRGVDARVKNLVMSSLRNCAMDVATHRTLLTTSSIAEEVEMDNDSECGEWLLVKLVLPLAGGYSEDSNGVGDHFTKEEMDRLPLDLQYLPPGKIREPDSVIRTNLLETLLQLCRTRYGRIVIRASNVYLVLREYHKWERVPAVKLKLENLIDVLIKTEEELGGVDDLAEEVEVPSEMADKFDRLDRQVLKEAESEVAEEVRDNQNLPAIQFEN